MSETVENLSTLKINYLTQEQYDAAVSSGIIQENELYLTPTSGEQSALPSGGLMGQVLAKSSDDDYEVAWSTIHDIPSGGSTGQVLAKSSNDDYAVAWTTAGSDIFLVTVTYNGSTYVADKTYAEILSAYNGGERIYLTYSYNGKDRLFNLAEKTSDSFLFSYIYSDSYTTPTRNNLRNMMFTFTSSGLTLTNLPTYGVPQGGSIDQVLTKSGSTDGAINWTSIRQVPSGGTAGQVVTKTSLGYGWADAGGLPSGGSTGQVLAKSSNADYEVAWTTIDAGHGLPSGGTTGQILAKSSNSDYSVAWTSLIKDVYLITGTGSGLTITINKTFDEIAAAIGHRIIILQIGSTYYYYNFTKNNVFYFITALDPTASNGIEYEYVSVYKRNGNTKANYYSKSIIIPSLPGNLAQSEVWVLREYNSNWQLSNVGIGDISELIDDEDVQSDINQYVMIRKEVSNYNPPTYEALYEDYILCKRYTVYDSDNDVRIGHAVFCSSFEENGTTKVKTIDVASEWGAWDDLATATITFSEAEIGGSALPSGGLTGQVLAKSSSTDYAVAWSTIHDIPAGGSTGQILTKSSDSDYSIAWVTPSGGGGGGETIPTFTYNENTYQYETNDVTDFATLKTAIQNKEIHKIRVIGSVDSSRLPAGVNYLELEFSNFVPQDEEMSYGDHLNFTFETTRETRVGSYDAGYYYYEYYLDSYTFWIDGPYDDQSPFGSMYLEKKSSLLIDDSHNQLPYIAQYNGTRNSSTGGITKISCGYDVNANIQKAIINKCLGGGVLNLSVYNSPDYYIGLELLYTFAVHRSNIPGFGAQTDAFISVWKFNRLSESDLHVPTTEYLVHEGYSNSVSYVTDEESLPKYPPDPSWPYED